ncbi:MAG TPA: ATP-binding cassette domain-containing protein [Polyangiaceae bacterium]|nr:ATP-binding cassette domain-containing protein [Polyangiaceae bacterium]
MTAIVELSSVSLRAPGGRPLFDGLDLRIEREHVALVGRNGVGKSTLLAVLAGHREAESGRVVTRGQRHFVAQADEQGEPLSLGERRRAALQAARDSGAELLLLDEPSEHLDEGAVVWLRDWLGAFRGCLVVATHDRRLLADFRHFFVVSESGCRYFCGSLEQLDTELLREHRESEQRYLRNLQRLAAEEEHTLHVARRKARKKRHGRVNELDRATPRILLNQKRDHAQVSHGRLSQLREARLASLRSWTQSTRRALNVSLSLDLPAPRLPADLAPNLLTLSGVSVERGERRLFESIDLTLGRERVAVIGPNGAGKTTLLEVMLGRRRPSTGTAQRQLSRVGYIEQGGANWLLDDSLLTQLITFGESLESATELLLAHKFPLALGQRPLRSLSPGERARAALICLFARTPAVELLVLDEPTFSLDLLGQRALTQALCAWPGALVVASHDHDFLEQIGIQRTIRLGPSD